MAEWKLQFLSAGYCEAPMALAVQGCSWKPGRFPAIVGVLTHATYGVVLFDTGYSNHFLTAVRQWPNQLYGWLAPVTCPSSEDAKHQLGRRGISPKDVRCIVISHFHADHISGLRDFPYARFLFPTSAWAALAGKRGFSALKMGYIPGLVPDDFEARANPLVEAAGEPLPPELQPFTRGWPLLPNVPIWIVPLPGHTVGHIGLLVSRADGYDFLVGDAVFTRQAYMESRLPHRVAQSFFADRTEYLGTIQRLRQLSETNPNVRIIPSHCTATASEICLISQEDKDKPNTFS